MKSDTYSEKEERKRKLTLYFHITNRFTIQYKSLESNN